MGTYETIPGENHPESAYDRTDCEVLRQPLFQRLGQILNQDRAIWIHTMPELTEVHVPLPGEIPGAYSMTNAEIVCGERVPRKQRKKGRLYGRRQAAREFCFLLGRQRESIGRFFGNAIP